VALALAKAVVLPSRAQTTARTARGAGRTLLCIVVVG
jgi:hypothetical protein